MFARALLSFHPAPFPQSNFFTRSSALLFQTPLFPFNNFPPLSFLISLPSPASSIISALLFKKPGGGGGPWSNQSLSAASLPSLFHHLAPSPVERPIISPFTTHQPPLSDARFLRPACFTGAEGSPITSLPRAKLRGHSPPVTGHLSPATDRLKATDRGMARGNFGERLKRERELREVTLEEITQATRIGSRFLGALENEEWDKLPGGVFNRGFVRSIAHYLGLDEEAFLAEYDLAYAAHADQLAQKHSQRIEDRIPPTPVWIPVALVLGILLLLAAVIYGGIYGWGGFVRHSPPKPTASNTSPSTNASLNVSASPLPPSNSASLPAANPPVAGQSPLDLSVSASTLTHVRVQADGNLVLDNPIRPGENGHFPADPSFVVTAADSSAVLLELNGEAMPPVGAPGTSGTIILTRKNLRQASGGNSQP